ncbi:MAG: hypothetical protein CMJ27_03615 [Phycisphaerae bacterium]|nr:hypothetical protein [Phycisphaerae bacterium]
MSRSSHGSRAVRITGVTLALLLASVTSADGGPPAGTSIDRRTHPAVWRPEAPPRVAVADAGAARLDRTAVLVGGFTANLAATAAVQVRHPRHGWEPVGCALLTPRAAATVIPLDEARLLVIGGWTGILPDEVTRLGSVEICEPARPHRRRGTPPPFETADDGLDGHAATMLPDGRVVLMHRNRLAIFDPESEQWSPPTPIDTSCLHASVATVGPDHLVLIGGELEEGEAVVRSIHLAADGIRRVDWSDRAMPAVHDAASIVLDEDRILVVGGSIDGESDPGIWILDAASRAVRPGPTLPIDGGIAGATLHRSGFGILVVGGERRIEGRPVPSHGAAIVQIDRNSARRLPEPLAAAIRTAILPGPGGIERIGGYRFEAADRDRGRASVLEDAASLRLVPVVIAD